MIIGVHAKILSQDRLNGIGFYTYNLLRAMSRLDFEHRYILYSNKPLIHKIFSDNFSEQIFRFPGSWSYTRLPIEFVRKKHDLLFVPKEMVPFFIRPRTVIVCYDLMGLIFADRISLEGRIHFWLAINHAIKMAERVIAISESTKQDIIKKCKVDPEKVIVTHLGYDADLYRPGTDIERIATTKKKYGITRSYVINTSSLLWYRKNLPRLIRAFRLFNKKAAESFQLVITGNRGEAYDEIVGLIRNLSMESDVVLTDYVPTEEMPLLLQGAEALVFPSLHEGFGLPVLEAMACGCPVISSNCSAIPEVVGDAGLLVDPLSEEDIAAAIDKVVLDAGLQRRLRTKGFERARLFSWDRTARQTLKIFNSL